MTGILDNSSDQDLQDMAAYYDSQERQLSGAQEITLVGITDPQEALALGEKTVLELKTGVAACIACHLRLVRAMVQPISCAGWSAC